MEEYERLYARLCLERPRPNDARRFDLHVARLGSDLQINVKSPENNGRKLLHDFVVLALAREPMNAGTKQMRLLPSNAPQASAAREAIAAWITESDQIEPIQAVGGWLR